MSYAAGLNDDLEDSLLNSDENEEDNELSSILEKIFAEASIPIELQKILNEDKQLLDLLDKYTKRLQIKK